MMETVGLYSNLPDKRSIRVFDLEPGDFHAPIRCCLRLVNLDESPEFTAISYAWGDPHITKAIACKPVEPDHEYIECQITVNLHDGLRRCRLKDRSVCLWADAICINQVDNEEKSWQIQLMARVFTLSNNTIIWLGELDCAEEIYHAIHEIRTYLTPEVISFRFDPNAPQLFNSHCSELVSVGKATLFDVDHHLIDKICEQPYFRRKWIIQEVVLSQSAIMLCSDMQMSWLLFIDMMNSLLSLHALSSPRESSVKGRNFSVTKSDSDDPTMRITRIIGMTAKHRYGSGHLLELMHEAAAFSCVDARDHLYAVLAIARGHLKSAINPNYALSPEEVYQNLAVLSLSDETSRLTLLLYNTNRSLPSLLHLPSWVPDWTRLEVEVPVLRPDHPPLFHATTDRSKTLKFSQNYSTLRILGLRLCAIAATTASLSNCLYDPTAPDPAWLESDNSADWRLHTWFQQIKLIAEKVKITNKDILGLTTICGQYRDPGVARAPVGHGCTIYEEFERLADSFKSPKRLITDHPDFPFLKIIVPSVSLFAQFSWRRRFFVTSNGLCGMGPRNMQAGDFVCLLFGGDVPYVLRPDIDGTCTFVGHCYLHGMMEGEGLDLDLPEETFTIR